MGDPIFSFSSKRDGGEILEGKVLFADKNNFHATDIEAARVEIQDPSGPLTFKDSSELKSYLEDKGVKFVRVGERGDLSEGKYTMTLDRFIEKHRFWWTQAEANMAAVEVPFEVSESTVNRMFGKDRYKNLGKDEKNRAKKKHQELLRIAKEGGFEIAARGDGDLSIGGVSEGELEWLWTRLKQRYPDSGDTEGVLNALIEMGVVGKMGDAEVSLNDISQAENDYSDLKSRDQRSEWTDDKGDLGLTPPKNLEEKVDRQLKKSKKHLQELLMLLRLLISMGDTDLIALYMDLYSQKKKLNAAEISGAIAKIQSTRDEHEHILMKKALGYAKKAAKSNDRAEIAKWKEKEELIRSTIRGLQTLDRPLQGLADLLMEEAQSTGRAADTARQMRSRDKGRFM